MAMKIVEECISCGNCEPECPNQSISQGDSIYVIAHERCTECVGSEFEAPQCVAVCPVSDCIVVDPAFSESREALEAKYQSLHA